MRKILSLIIILLCSGMLYSQDLDSIKFIEVISPLEDSMVVLNKHDVNVINKTFYEKRILDSTNSVNESMLINLSKQNKFLDSIIYNQKCVIKNDSLLINHLNITHKQLVDKYNKDLKKECRRKNTWKATTGISILTIILIILL